MTNTNPVTAAMLVIGDEVLSGRTQDTNTQSAARALGEIGIGLSEVRVVADEQQAIIRAVNALRAQMDYVLTSGGIGATHDDITALSVARAFGVGCEIRDDARAILMEYYGERLNDTRLRMARIPVGAELIPNPVTGAPGFRIENVFVMAGIPRVFKAMLVHACTQMRGGPVVLQDTLPSPVPEGVLSAPLEALAARHAQVSFGSYPSLTEDGRWSVNVVIRTPDREALSAARAELEAMLTRLDAEHANP